ncbi:MAG: TatD family hydrolase [Thermoplasmatota archaeon]
MSASPEPRFPVWDNHFHLDPLGRRAEAVKEFARAGGTHMMLVHKPYWREGQARRYNSTLEHHREQFDLTLRLAEDARSVLGASRVFVALAPHPAEFTKMIDAGHTMEEAASIQRAANELAARYVRDGKAVAMSEVGRPHWRPVADDVMAKANELMLHSFGLARDAGCAVQIHAETATPESFADLAAWADRARLPRERVVKHYSTPLVDVAVNHGLWPSVLVGKGSAEEAARGGARFLMETDYTDEPLVEDVETKKRTSGYSWRHANPTKTFGVDCRVVGATGEVLGPKTVPRRTLDLIARGLFTEEQAWTVHAENPKRVYGVDVDL